MVKEKAALLIIIDVGSKVTGYAGFAGGRNQLIPWRGMSNTSILIITNRASRCHMERQNA
jgi:hypothetical protein